MVYFLLLHWWVTSYVFYIIFSCVFFFGVVCNLVALLFFAMRSFSVMLRGLVRIVVCVCGHLYLVIRCVVMVFVSRSYSIMFAGLGVVCADFSSFFFRL